MPLLPCSSCRRHVRADASICPFCQAKTTGRKAAGLLAATLGAALATGCPQQAPPPRAVAEYGAPPPPSTPAPPRPGAAPSETPGAATPSTPQKSE